MVARAWVDPEYKRRLLATIAELGYTGRQGEDMVVLENTPAVHDMVVCTLCSCYPWPVLGLPPVWYKSAPYRSRAVIDPRCVLREFGVALPDDVEVGVPQRSIMEILGHRDPRMTMRYQHLSPGHLRDAIQALDEAPPAAIVDSSERPTVNARRA